MIYDFIVCIRTLISLIGVKVFLRFVCFWLNSWLSFIFSYVLVILARVVGHFCRTSFRQLYWERKISLMFHFYDFSFPNLTLLCICKMMSSTICASFYWMVWISLAAFPAYLLPRAFIDKAPKGVWYVGFNLDHSVPNIICLGILRYSTVKICMLVSISLLYFRI